MRRALHGLAAAALVLAGVGAGCKSAALPERVTLSTKHSAVPAHYRSMGLVRAEQCGVVVVIIPVLDPWIPLQVYDELLTKAEALRADAVIDFHVRGAALAGFYPFFIRACTEYVGTAVRFE